MVLDCFCFLQGPLRNFRLAWAFLEDLLKGECIGHRVINSWLQQGLSPVSKGCAFLQTTVTDILLGLSSDRKWRRTDVHTFRTVHGNIWTPTAQPFTFVPVWVSNPEHWYCMLVGFSKDRGSEFKIFELNSNSQYRCLHIQTGLKRLICKLMGYGHHEEAARKLLQLNVVQLQRTDSMSTAVECTCATRQNN